MEKINLKNVTLVAISSIRINQTLKALNICKNFCDFHDCIFFTHKKVNFNYIKIPVLKNINDYNNFVVKKLSSYIKSDYCLTIHWDGFIVNPNAWTDDFFKYDYIGSPWPQHDNICGNGGFCLKSKKFLNVQEKYLSKMIVNEPEDVILSFKLRDLFKKEKCKYAPPKVAYKFATEKGNYENNQSFGFHSFKFNPQFKKLITNK
jgi:hypothetical protein